MSVMVQIMGLPEAEAYLERLQAGCAAAGRELARAGSGEPYAWGIEFGRQRSGRLARRAGGSFALTTALEQVRPRIAPTLADALPKGPTAVLAAALGLAVEIANAAKPLEPAVSGNLRRSLHAEPGAGAR